MAAAGWLWIALACGGCKQLLGFDDVSPVSDASIRDGSPKDTAPDPTVCPAAYNFQITGVPSLYRIALGVSAQLNWLDAEVACRVDGTGTHLAIPQTQTEHQALEDAVTGATVWLGVTDRITHGTWRPITGGAESDWFADWFGGAEPAPSTTLNCLTLAGFGSEEATPCDGTDPQFFRGYICECDGIPIDPAAF